ncbi:hypothetical protein DPMN_068570 [Dreissena polymorpha]|uniref:Uncharacterized protein n=1 Tax=Dreissena polymorpha TaxID=45954 RepID=A0A9D3Z2Q7_DREPO|nr:hypothetical protein DPMN_068570 [Dreissena polymorpha]
MSISVSSWSVRVATEARSVILEPDVFHTAGIAVFSKMQRTCHPLFIVESSPARTCQRSCLKRARDGGTARTPAWGTYGTDLGLCTVRGETQGGGFREGPWDSGTQYAQRTGETVLGMKPTANDNKWAIQAELCAAAVLRSDMNLSIYQGRSILNDSKKGRAWT